MELKENWKDIRLQNDSPYFGVDPTPNTGFQLMRASRKTEAFLQVIVDLCAAQPNVNDQVSFSKLMKEHPWNELITLTYLDETVFPNGARYWDRGLPPGTEPFMIHNNFIVGMGPKINRFVAANLWFSDLPAFFKSEDRYLTVTLPMNDNSERAQALKAAVSLAVHLNRVLIMPPDSQDVSIEQVKKIVPVIDRKSVV